MPDGRPILTGQRREAFDLLVKGESTTDVARLVGVSDRTVRRWRLEPVFAEALAQVQGDAIETARATLTASARELAEVVVDLALTPTAPEAVRLRAACEGLDRIGLRGEESVTDDGESAVLSADGSTLTLGGRRYVAARPSGHEGDPEVTASEGEEDHSETP